jgi:hypothetical protein
VPDDFDYAWFGWILAHPDEWSAEDLANAEAVLVVQRQAVAATHPKDKRGRERAAALVSELDTAIRQHRERTTRPGD